MTYPTHRTGFDLPAALAEQTAAEGRADALRVSEIRYRRLFETAGDGILLLDSSHGRITDANPFMSELLGYSHEELIDKELWEIGLLEDKAASQEAFRQLRQQNYIRYEDLPLRTRGGELREVEFVSNLYREDGHTVIQCNIRDITEQRRVAAELAVIAARSHRIAEILQRSMLQEPPAGEFPGIAVETLYAAALGEAEVGGDFFDAFAMSGGKVALVVGDVSGKGLAAAGRTAEVKYSLRAFLHGFPEPAVALGQLNAYLCATHERDISYGESFIILAVVVLDIATGETVFSAAGAEPTLILRADGRVERVLIIGLPLGIEPSAVYSTKTLRLEIGETVMMTTDGITEARCGRAFLGIEGLIGIMEQTGPSASLRELSQAVYSGARDFAAEGLRDDVCLLLARMHV